MSSIEGFRGEPRNKPPYPVHEGLFGKPTVINNVETLANVPRILLEGGSSFAALGTPNSTGTRLFCVSGNVERPGIYEITMGATLGDLIAKAGGVSSGREIKAILLGGAAGTFVTAKELDVPLSFEGVKDRNATLGSGVVLVFDAEQDMSKIVLRIAEFFRDESCGQCVPCRVGVVRQEELLHRLLSGRPLGSYEQERSLFGEIRDAMKDASICGLGQTAASAIDSALELAILPIHHLGKGHP